MPYYVMVDDEVENENGEALFEIHNCFEVANVMSWAGGRVISEPIPDPIQIDYDTFRGFSGPPVDLWDDCLPLMSTRLGDALTQAGVDNIQFFPAILKNTQTKESYNYYVFNVVGLVSAADLSKSEFESYDGRFLADTSFFSLSIDEHRGRGLLMFRLTENISALVVHERVCEHVIAAGIPEERFAKPEDWAQL